MQLRYLRIFLAVFLLLSPALVNAHDVRIALRAHQGDAKALSLWQATADHLSRQLPEHRFILVPFENIGVMNQAVSLGNFKFSLTNPSSVVEYQVRYGLEPVVTLMNKRQGHGYSKFGSVIFTRSDREDINNIEDLKNKSVISVDELAFGGWRVAWKEFLNHQINPYEDFKKIKFAGGTQQDVVYSVQKGKSDAGIVRTDMLERLAASNKIKLTDFKVLGQKKVEGFPFLLSTDLYPEWSFSIAKDVDPILKDKIVKALLSITENDKAAIEGMYIKWIDQLDLGLVRELLQDLKVGPFNIAKMNAYQRLISQYGVMFFIALSIILILSFAFLYTLKLNKQILSAKEALKTEEEVRLKLERQLMHSQRIESLGQLTGGIAHDFNNMLGSIMGFTELALFTDSAKNDPKLTRYLKQVVSSSEKSSALIAQMLAFSRTAGDNDKKENLSVADLVNEIYQLLQPMLPSSLNCIVKPIDENLFINTNSLLLTQTLMNLYLNAKDAMTNEHGTITIGANVVHFEALDVFCDSCHQDIRGSYVEIFVEDNGSGIDAETRAHLFDPFFTTKEVSKGTGMGLSMVHGIVHKHEGHIIVESEVGVGSVIKVLFPRVNKIENIQKKNKASHKGKTKIKKISNKHIMIVDDESSLTIYLSEFLRQHGFSVTAFNDSEEALHYFKEHFDDIDLVITDQTMPNLTGIELSEKILECSENVSIIVCSGYGEAINEKLKSVLNIAAYMEKPIQSNKLLETIESLL